MSRVMRKCKPEDTSHSLYSNRRPGIAGLLRRRLRVQSTASRTEGYLEANSDQSLILAHDFVAGELFNPRRLCQEKDQLTKKTKWNSEKRMSTSESKFVPHSHILQCPEGSGYYSDNQVGCYDVILGALPLVLEVIKSATVEPGSVFTICDYGCADGGTSMPLLYACVQELRKIHGDDLPISVIYEDQPVNDFKSLFLRLQGLIPGPKSYFLDFPNVFVTTCGTNFYNECLPPHSVNLGFSSMAFHWLSRKPCDITGALHQPMITVKEEAEKFKEQAEKDWETILLARAKELAPGGRLVIVQSVVNEKGHNEGEDTPVSRHLTLRDLWQGLVTDGLISQEEFHKTTFAYYLRTVDECKIPFTCRDSPVRRAGLSLVSIETKTVPCAYRQKWLKHGGDPKAHARWYVPAMKSWSNSTFLSGLCDKRSPEEKQAIVDELFERYENKVAKCPEDHGIDLFCAYMLIEKSQKAPLI